MYIQTNINVMNINNYSGVIIHSENEIHKYNEDFTNLVNIESTDEIMDKSIYDFIEEEYISSLQNKFENVKNNDTKLGLKIKLNSDISVIVVSSITENDKIKTIFINIDENQDKLNISLKNNALDRAPIGITIANINLPDEPLIYVNDGFLDMIGYSKSEVIGQNCRFLQGEQTNKDSVKKLREAIDAKKSETVELINYKKDGTKFWNRVTITPIITKDDEITHYLRFQEDISATKLYEKEKNVFEKHAEASEQAMFVTDSNWNIEYVNPAFEKETGYSQEEIYGESANKLRPNYIDSELTDKFEVLDNAIQNGLAWKGKLKNVKKSGEIYQIKQTVTPITNSAGDVDKFTIIQDNITKDRLNKQVLDVLNRVLRHNLRTSINVIEGYTDILNSNCSDTQKKKSIRNIRERTGEMNEISDKMKQIRNLVKGYDEPTPLKINEINDIVKPYRRINNTIIRLDIKDIQSRSIKYGDVFQIAFDEAINYALDNKTKHVSRIHVMIEGEENKENIAKITISDNKPPIDKSKWNIIKSGKETPLDHIDGIELWVLYWSITAIGGTINLSHHSDGNVFKMCVPLE